MKIGFTGTRKGMTPRQVVLLDQLIKELKEEGFTHLIHGGCRGADRGASSIAHKRGLLVFCRPGDQEQYDWARDDDTVVFVYSPEPYLKRNSKIVEECGALIAASGTMEEELRSGTWATVRRARDIGLSIVIMWPDGTTTVEGVK